ncbi:MAG TPA: LeuA family protein [bacterium]|nr:LeuA family protein [bacterium]HMW35943.1 LeuA family protein [bacterium]HMZ05564.1 LeuA family protein [bacterium]HNB09307.1 LeuA family protein [bacterium]HNC48810.1 LeuA family protein [bacterium]
MDLNTLIYDWNQEVNAEEKPAHAFELNDETLRDGLQSPSVKTPTLEQKIEILHLMEGLGIHAADIGLPGAGPHVLEHVVALAAEIAKNKFKIQPNCAARTLKVDIDPIIEASQRTGIPIQACTFIGSSPIRQYAEGWGMDQLLKFTEEAVSYAVKNNLDVMYVTEDTTRAHPNDVKRLYLAAIRSGARRVCISDTVGNATPEGVQRLVRFMVEVIKESGEDVKIDWHGHNDRGLAVANAIIALQAGAHRVHGTGIGVGERVGNVQMDQLMVNLKLKNWITNDLTTLPQYCRKISEYTGIPIPINYPVFGHDAFRTGTGVHAAAILKSLNKGDMELVDRVYSSVPAAMFGLEQVVEIGPLSGESNVVFWLKRRKIEPREELVKKIFAAAKQSQTVLSDEQIFSLCR